MTNLLPERHADEMLRITVTMNRTGNVDCTYEHSAQPEAAIVLWLGLLENAKVSLLQKLMGSTE